jgi:hypothetical protein
MFVRAGTWFMIRLIYSVAFFATLSIAAMFGSKFAGTLCRCCK